MNAIPNASTVVTGTVPADIVALLPTTVHTGFDDLADPDDDCYFAHDVQWADNLQGCCRDCGRLFDPDDLALAPDVRERIEQAAWAADLIKGPEECRA